MSKSNIVPLNQNETPNPNRLSFTLEEMLAEFENGAVPRSKYWKELITALYDTANHVVTGVTSVAKVKPDNVGNIPLLPKDIDAPAMVRMDGADSNNQQTNQDVFGRSLFYGDACKVRHKFEHFFELLAGDVLLAGLKFFYPGLQELLIEDLPNNVWINVYSPSIPMEDRKILVDIVVSNDDLKDYVDTEGVQHFLNKIASINKDKVVSDSRVVSDREIRYISVDQARIQDNSLYERVVISNRANAPFEKINDSNASSYPETAKFYDKSGQWWGYVYFSTPLINHLGAVGDGADATEAIRDVKQKGFVAYYPSGNYPDTRNGEFYLYATDRNYARANLGHIRYAYGGTIDRILDDTRPVLSVEKMHSTSRTDNPFGSFDLGAIYAHVTKKGGDTFATGITSSLRSEEGRGDSIAIHARTKGVAGNSEIFGLWAYCDIDPTDKGIQIYEAIGQEINLNNRGNITPDFRVRVIPPGVEPGDYRGLNIVTADGSNPCNIGIDVGAQLQSDSKGFYMGVRLRADGIIPSSEVTPVDEPKGTTCQLAIQGTQFGDSKAYGGISFNFGSLIYGIDMTGANYREGRAIQINSGDSIFIGDKRVLGDQYSAIPDSDGGDESDKINEILSALRSHGLIAS